MMTDEAARGSRGFDDWAATALLAAAAQFIVLTVVAMLVYEGGSKFDPSAGGYAFFRNFFSDLGMTEAYGDHANAFAMTLFTYALTCVGVTLAAFGVAVRHLKDAPVKESGRDVAPERGSAGERGGGPARGARAAAALAALAAVVSGVSYVGIAFTPHDVAAAAHEQFVNAAFGFLLVFVLCLGYLEIRAGWLRRLIVTNFVYAGLLAAYVYLLFWGPSTEYERGLVIQVVAQKVIVYSSIVNLGWQALGFRRALRAAAAGAHAGELAVEPAGDPDTELVPAPAVAFEADED
jgi:hypothetical protein